MEYRQRYGNKDKATHLFKLGLLDADLEYEELPEVREMAYYVIDRMLRISARAAMSTIYNAMASDRHGLVVVIARCAKWLLQ